LDFLLLRRWNATSLAAPPLLAFLPGIHCEYAAVMQLRIPNMAHHHFKYMIQQRMENNADAIRPASE